MTHPHAGPREKIICVAASTQIFKVKSCSHFGVMYALIPSIAPGKVNPLTAKMIKTMYGKRDVKYTTRPEDLTPLSKHPETRSQAKNKVKADLHLGNPYNENAVNFTLF